MPRQLTKYVPATNIAKRTWIRFWGFRAFLIVIGGTIVGQFLSIQVLPSQINQLTISVNDLETKARQTDVRIDNAETSIKQLEQSIHGIHDDLSHLKKIKETSDGFRFNQ